MSEKIYEDEIVRKGLKKAYEEAVEDYVRVFMKKQNINCNGWINDEIGGIITCSDYFINFDDIKADIDLDAPVGLYFGYYDDAYEAAMNKKSFPNYKNYIKLKS